MGHVKRKLVLQDCVSSLCIAALFFGVDMPDNVIRETIDFVASTLGHFGESFSFGLILESVAGKVDA